MMRYRFGLGLALFIVTAACEDTPANMSSTSGVSQDDGGSTRDTGGKVEVSGSGGSTDTSEVNTGRPGSAGAGGVSSTQSAAGESGGGAPMTAAMDMATAGAAEESAGQGGVDANAMMDEDDAGVADMTGPAQGSSADTGGTGGSGGMAGGPDTGTDGASGSGGEMMADAGTATQGMLNAACLTLQLCCENRQGDERTACERVLDSRDFGGCRGALGQYCAPEQPTQPPPPPCVMLRACCDARTGSERTDCELVANAGDATVCEAATPNFCMTNTPRTQECTALQACCDSVQDDNAKRDCERVLMASDPVVCRAATVAYCPDRRPQTPGTPPAECSMLAACCMQLTNEGERRNCEAAVERGQAGECRGAANNFCRAGMGGMPDPSADACMNLQSCCASVDNLGNRAVCEAIAATRDSQMCQRETDRFCGDQTPPGN